MKTIIKIARNELRNLFYSPIAWLILIVFTFQCGMAFSGLISNLVRNETMGYGLSAVTVSLFGGWNGLFSTVQSYLYLYIPLLTMGLMSRELGSGSIKLLYSSPITNTQIILGKYVAMMAYGLALILVLLVFAVYGIVVVKDADVPVIFTGLLGVYFLICAYSAIGLFMSSITAYQIVAAVGTLAVLAALNYVKGLWQNIDFVRDITYWLAISGRSDTFVSGMITSEDVLYFIIVPGLFLAMAVIRLQSRRVKTSFLKSCAKYVMVWLVAIVVGYLSSRPALMKYLDVTRTETNTLTPDSREIVKRAKGGLTITTYVNLLDKNFWIGVPSRVNEDLQLFKQYLRFKPEIKMEYVYYYDSIANESLERGFPDLTDEERAKKVMELNKINPKKVLSPEQIRELIDVKSEGNRTVRLMERESGEKTFLRIFDDNMIFPYEPEISAALKRMVMKLPKVGFVTGHGERSAETFGERDYSMFAQYKPFRHALINQGFDIATITLQQPVPEEINILVMADMKSPLTTEETANFEAYVARGGNLMLMGEAGRGEVMNPVAEKFGAKFTDGVLVQHQEMNPDNLTVARPTPQAVEMSYIFERMSAYGYDISMPTACGIEYSGNSGDYAMTPLFVTDSAMWNEMNTQNFIDETPELNPELGETRQPYVVGIALTKPVGDKTQKILIYGDADCISNEELGRSRNGVQAANYWIIQGSFFWLSNGEVPVDVRRPVPPDNKIYVSEAQAKRNRFLFFGLFPGILLLTYLVIWIRRRSR